MYRIYKYLIYVPFLVLWTFVLFLGVLVIAPFSQGAASRIIGGLWGRGLVHAVPCKLTCSGLENIDRGKSYVVAANHLSLMDIPMLYGWLPLDIKWVMKKEIRRIPLIGLGTKLMGHIFLDRANHKAAMLELQRLKENLEPGTSILIFPEGTRSRDGKLKSFKMGAFHMAKDLEIPVLPVTLRGSDAILTPDGMDLNPGSAEIVFHPPISREEVADSDPEAIRDRCRQIIADAL